VPPEIVKQPDIVAPPPPPVALPAQPAIDYPTRPVTTIVPFAAGGATDLVARLAGDYISRSAGQRVIVENKPGAGGAIGTEMVVRSAPDGYTVGMFSTTDVLNGFIYRKLTYNPIKDLAPVGMIGRTAQVIVVPASSSAKTLADFIARARANPGKLRYASSGDGTASHLSAAQMARAAGIDLVHVRYAGIGPAMVDLFAGRVDIMHVSPTVRADVQAGRVRALAIVGRERWPEAFPNVPSMAELGLSENDFDMWYGMVVPRGTPAPIVEKLNLLLRRMTADPASRESLGKFQVRPVSMTSAEFAATISALAPKLERLVKDLNLAKD
jgi:tripartite-type tricarboxylate transporter receptor subunit TctC